MIFADNFFRQCRQWLAVDFHNQAVRFEIRIHPVERKTFLDVKFAVGIFVKNDFDQQPIDFHYGNLPADLNPPIWIQFDIFARLELMVLQPLFRILRVILKTFLRIFIRGHINFATIHRAQVIEICSVCQRVLSQREKWIGVHMGFLHRCDQEPSGIRAAKINASRRNGFNDVIAKIGRIFFIALNKSIKCTPSFQYGLPLISPQTLIIGVFCPRRMIILR